MSQCVSPYHITALSLSNNCIHCHSNVIHGPFPFILRYALVMLLVRGVALAPLYFS